jgi:enamine deaminase RidA (YjgF/YER057c/UK114 family)
MIITSRRHELSAVLAILWVSIAWVVPAAAGEPGIVRRPSPGFPIASSVQVPAGKTLYFLSGTIADPADPLAPASSPLRMGDTAAQAKNVFGKITKELEAVGLGMADVVKMNVFLVGDPGKDGRMDFEGLMQAYSQYFGTATQPNLPARTTVQVSGLPLPGALIEVEVIAAR